MQTYSIHINQRSIGIGFIQVSNVDTETVGIEEQVVVSELLRHSKGYELGVSIGDTLLAINGKFINSTDAYFLSKIPFNATFLKSRSKLINDHDHTTSDYCLHNMESKINVTSKKFAHSMDLEKYKKYQISNYIQNDNKYNIKFKMYNNENKTCLISSKGFNNGCHYWSFKVLKCDIYRQEIGVVSNTKINDFGARAMYVNDMANNKVYYASYNSNGGKERCYKELIQRWNKGDIVKIYLDLHKWKIKFYLNDKKVRKAISVEPYKKYYPILSFMGNCKYQYVNVN